MTMYYKLVRKLALVRVGPLTRRIMQAAPPPVWNPRCLYCGDSDCMHALGWQSRAWSSEAREARALVREEWQA